MYPAVLSLLHLNTIVETVLNFFLKFPFKLYFDQLLLWFITLCDFFFLNFGTEPFIIHTDLEVYLPPRSGIKDC